MGKYEYAKKILEQNKDRPLDWCDWKCGSCEECYRKKILCQRTEKWGDVKKFFEDKIAEYDSRKSWKRRAASWIMEARQYIPKDIALNLDGFDLVFEYEKKKAKA